MDELARPTGSRLSAAESGQPQAASRTRDWPSYCLAALEQAVAARDLPATRLWAAEFAAAVFTLADLHRWLGFLVQNQLTALGFQRPFAPLFAWANPLTPQYSINSHMDRFPAGMFCLHASKNYYEVERQAETLFRVPNEYTDPVRHAKNFSTASVWVHPSLRESYATFSEALSPHNQLALALAARSPFEHCYLASMLHRHWLAGSSNALSIVLKRFDTLYPHASVAELMSVLTCRGHFYAGLESSDRFQPVLMTALEGTCVPSEETAFQAAALYTHQTYRRFGRYGHTFTLREAFAVGRLDCIRATDMIGAIYSNAGRPFSSNIWWSAGVAGHAVAAAVVPGNGQRTILVLDGLAPANHPQVWPDAYFGGAFWPPELGMNPPPHSAELYVRGIDACVWAEGYVIRGDMAGTLTKAALPYLFHRDNVSTEKVYAGPYPPGL